MSLKKGAISSDFWVTYNLVTENENNIEFTSLLKEIEDIYSVVLVPVSISWESKQNKILKYKGLFLERKRNTLIQLNTFPNEFLSIVNNLRLSSTKDRGKTIIIYNCTIQL